jgi:hypothetical protein
LTDWQPQLVWQTLTKAAVGTSWCDGIAFFGEKQQAFISHFEKRMLVQFLFGKFNPFIAFCQMNLALLDQCVNP